MEIDPQPRATGRFEAQANGRIRVGFNDGMVPRYEWHHWVCPVARQRARERDLREALEREVHAAVEEGRRPAPGQLPLFTNPPAKGAARFRDGWVDLTLPYATHQSSGRRWNGVVVVDLRERPAPPRPN